MSNYHFNGYNCALFEGQRFAFKYPSLPMHGNSTEIFVAPRAQADQVEPNHPIAGICNTKKRGGSTDDRLFHCKRQRRKGGTSWETITLLPEHDGYLWRKYGEKKTMNNQHRRSYYKCAYKKEYNCKATKQVQQRDNSDPAIYNVTYFHSHVCPAAAYHHNKPFSISCPNSMSLSTNFWHIPDFSTAAPHCLEQEHSGMLIKEESTETSSAEIFLPVARSTRTTIMECLNCAEEEAGQWIEPTMNASDQLEKHSNMFSADQCWIDSNELNAVIYGVQKSESVGSNFETYDEIDMHYIYGQLASQCSMIV